MAEMATETTALQPNPALVLFFFSIIVTLKHGPQ